MFEFIFWTIITLFILSIALEVLNNIFSSIFSFLSFISRWTGAGYVSYINHVPKQHRHTKIVDLSYKDGLVLDLNIPKQFFPAITAWNLKGKKHEWIVIAFEKDGVIFKSYSHKGDDNQSVCILPFEVIQTYAERNNATYVLIVHNHPNGVLSASKEDKISARELSKILKKINVKLDEFVCARGRFIWYH